MTTWNTLRLRYSLLLTVAMAAAGCGGKAEEYEVAGTVTWKGRPVPAGEILFEPDPAAGNKGTQSRAEIEDGQFKTRPGLGSVGGAVIIRVTGYDGKPIPESKLGKRLFEPYELKRELPPQASVVEIDIPHKP